MNASDFISIADGEPCDLEIPDPVAIPVSETHGNLIVTKMVKAKMGDAEYDQVLVTWMFINGYVLKNEPAQEAA